MLQLTSTALALSWVDECKAYLHARRKQERETESKRDAKRNGREEERRETFEHLRTFFFWAFDWTFLRRPASLQFRVLKSFNEEQFDHPVTWPRWPGFRFAPDALLDRPSATVPFSTGRSNTRGRLFEFYLSSLHIDPTFNDPSNSFRTVVFEKRSSRLLIILDYVRAPL